MKLARLLYAPGEDMFYVEVAYHFGDSNPLFDTDPKLVGNLCTISLLSHMSKVFESSYKITSRDRMF